MSNSEFTCPFQIRGEKTPSLFIEVDATNSENIEQNQNEIGEATRNLLRSTAKESIAVIVDLPTDIIDGKKKPREVEQRKFIPYVSAAITAEILHIANPLEVISRSNKNGRGDSLSLVLEKESLSNKFDELNREIEKMLTASKKDGYGFMIPSIFCVNGEFVPEVVGSLGGTLYTMQDMYRDAGNRDGLLFIFQGPIYPEGIGRHNENLRMVISRKSDFNSEVNATLFKQIKEASRRSLEAANITNSPVGGWFIPEIES